MEINIKSSNDLIEYLKMIDSTLIRCLSIVLIVGIIGNSLSIIVFSDKQFRKNGISLLFRSASVFNIVVLIYGIGTSFYSLEKGPPEKSSLIFCKLRLYLRHIFLMIVRSYIILACIASYSLTSSRLKIRSLFDIQYVKLMIIIVPFLWPLIAIHMPILTYLKGNKCVNTDGYVLPFGIYFFLIVGIIPVILMTFFILLTMKNLNEIHRRIQPSIPTLNSRRQTIKSRDKQFIRMLLSLVLMYIVTNVFYPANVLYMSITHSLEKTPQRIEIESLVITFTSNYILYINNISPFFLFMISSNSFRRSLFQLFHRYFQRPMQHLLNHIRLILTNRF